MGSNEKGWVWIREQKNAVCFYLVKFGEKRERVIAVPYSEVVSRQQEILKLFSSSANKIKLNKYFRSFESLNKEKIESKKVFLTCKQITEAMALIEESLADLVKHDPKCQKPENRQLGYEIWRDWRKIRPHVNTMGGWNIKESDSQKALGWGSAGKKED